MQSRATRTAVTDDDDLERRKHRRKWTRWPARLRTSGGTVECRVLNFSYRGAKLQVAADFRDREPVTLVMEPLGEFSGVVRWHARDCVGLRFANHYMPGIRGRLALPRVRLAGAMPPRRSASE
ncbi:MAG TPA: PilZ domain-containing protein [Stellaceae bacterium]|nr:PilZ domain-containing protein [Stellaceae bacterium]